MVLWAYELPIDRFCLRATGGFADLPIFWGLFQTVNTLEAIFLQRGWSLAATLSGVWSFRAPVWEVCTGNGQESENGHFPALWRTARNDVPSFNQLLFFSPSNILLLWVLCGRMRSHDQQTDPRSAVPLSKSAAARQVGGIWVSARVMNCQRA